MLGLGATLINGKKIVAFASKRLTDAESRHANIESELLEVVFVCEKFNTYVYGKEFQIKSDHEQLKDIRNKNIAQTPPKTTKNVIKAPTIRC